MKGLRVQAIRGTAGVCTVPNAEAGLPIPEPGNRRCVRYASINDAVLREFKAS